MPAVTIGKKTIFYEMIDKTGGIGNICVLIGGLTRDHTIWRKVIPLLSDKFRVLVFDNRDTGQSFRASKPYDMNDLAQDLIDLLNYLKIPSAHLIGHSMGGFIAIHLASKQPKLVNSLILCSTSAKQEPKAKEYVKQRIDFINQQKQKGSASTANPDDIRNAMKALYTKDFLKNKQKVEEILTFETSNPYPQEAESFKRQAIACMNYNAKCILKSMASIPAHIITGDEDDFYPPSVAQALANHFNSAPVHIIKSASHMIQIETPLAFANVIQSCIGFSHQKK